MKQVGTDGKRTEREGLIRNRLNGRAFLKKSQLDQQGPPTPEKWPMARAVPLLSRQHPHCSSLRLEGATWGSQASAGRRRCAQEGSQGLAVGAAPSAGSPEGAPRGWLTPLNVISACSPSPVRPFCCCYWFVYLFSKLG